MLILFRSVILFFPRHSNFYKKVKYSLPIAMETMMIHALGKPQNVYVYMHVCVFACMMYMCVYACEGPSSI